MPPQPADMPPRQSSIDDPAEARERTALAWTRSALNMAATGTLISRGAFEGQLDALAIASALALAALAALTWDRGRIIYRLRRVPGAHVAVKTEAFWLLTLATVGVAVLAIVVTVMT
jgi:uncharacterized membrane protein YidH (DUF202 family)